MVAPHELLGLEPGADEHAIKRAFRRLAMRWHPDRNPDPRAVEHFKALRAAYESLLAALRDSPDAAGADGDAEGGIPRGADRREDLVLTLEEAFLGCEKAVRLVRASPCTVCGGSGEETLSYSRLCAACHGSGRLRRRDGLVRCSACTGRGYLQKRDCTACGGSGQCQTGTTVAVKVPAGIRGGDELRLAGKGEAPAVVGGRPGDLLLRIALAPHPLFRLAGQDLVVRRPLSAFRLLLGGEVAVPVPGGVRRIAVEPGEIAPRVLRIDGAGFPGRRGHRAGALVVELEPVFPAEADGRLGRLVRALEAELARDTARHLPELAQWEAQWLGGAGERD